MTRRKKYIIFIVIWLTLFFLLGSGILNLQSGESIVIIYMVVTVLAYIIYAFANRCPMCRMPLLLRPVKFIGIEFYIWSVIIPGKCRHCGESIR